MTQCPWKASKQVLSMVGARELVLCVSVSQALRPSKHAAMQRPDMPRSARGRFALPPLRAS